MFCNRMPSSVLLCCLFAAMALVGCAQQIGSSGPGGSPQSPQISPERAEAEGNYSRAAELYMQAASQAPAGEPRQRLRFEAGLAAAQAGDTGRARQILASFTPSTLNDVDRARYELAQRALEIAGMSPSRALEQLPPPSSGTPPAVAERVWEKRAQLQFEQNDRIAGIEALVQRGVWLADDIMLRGNDQRIYDQALEAIAMGQGPQSRVAQNASRTTVGWLALADIGQRRWANREERDGALAEWEQTYPRHPATRAVLRERFDYQPSTSPIMREPGQRMQQAPRPETDTVALAVPLSGRFSNAAQAIRDGFMFAYRNDDSAPGQPLVFDTNGMSASALASRVRSERVGILVGPLDKTKVSELSQLRPGIPTIALNYNDETANPAGFYQFALAPEDEAREVARQAADEEGYRSALALVPDGDWGSRVFDAFRDGFEQRGGRILDYATYQADQHDHRQPIQALLRQARSADFIFVAGQPDQARLIRSQLRYYRASGLPMITTSHAYTGTPDAGEDIDLNSVRFVDMPWVIGDGNFLSGRRDTALSRYGNSAEHFKRLFAMGMDAWRLADRIGEQGLRADDIFEGMTGVLKVNDDGTVRRYLAFAVFRDGEPRLIRMPAIEDARNDTTTTTPDPWATP